MASAKSTVKQSDNNAKQSDNIKNVMAAAVQVQKNVSIILDQSDITLTSLPKLPTHQKAARDHAKKWDDVWKGVLYTTSEFIDYGTVFDESYKVMTDDVTTIDDENSTDDEKASATKDIYSILTGALLTTIQEKKKNATKLTTQIKNFHDSFQDAYNDFQCDFKAADVIITNDQTDLIKKQASLLKAQAVAEGLEYGLVIDSGLIPFTAGYTFAAGPVGTIVGGIVLGIEVAGLVSMLVAYATEMEKVNTIKSEIASENAEITELQGVETQITGLQTATRNIQQYSQVIENCWDTLEGDMKELIQRMKDAKPDAAAGLVKVEVRAVNDEWQKILAVVNKLRPDGGTIPSKKYANSADFLKAITPK